MLNHTNDAVSAQPGIEQHGLDTASSSAAPSAPAITPLTPHPSLQPRAHLRTRWHRTKDGWSATLEMAGYAVRVAQRKHGVYYRRLERRDGTQQWRSLKTTERTEAVARASAFLVELTRTMLSSDHRTLAAPQGSPRAATLGELTDLYFDRCSRFRENTPRWQDDQRRHMRMVLAHFGRNFEADLLTKNSLDEYTSVRRQGKLRVECPSKDKEGQMVVHEAPPVKARATQAEIKTLLSVLTFATSERRPDRSRYLDGMPFPRYSPEGEPNPNRPVSSEAYYKALRRAVVRTIAESKRIGTPESAALTTKHRRNLLALDLAWWAGRRAGALVALTWKDVDESARTILWRKETDKTGTETRTAMATAIQKLVRQLRPLLEPESMWLFPKQSNPTQHIGSDTLGQRILQMEKLAGVERLHGTRCHGLRRGFATLRQDLPREAVKRLGGWKDDRTYSGYIGENAKLDQAVVDNAQEMPVSRRRRGAAGVMVRPALLTPWRASENPKRAAAGPARGASS